MDCGGFSLERIVDACIMSAIHSVRSNDAREREETQKNIIIGEAR